MGTGIRTSSWTLATAVAGCSLFLLNLSAEAKTPGWLKGLRRSEPKVYRHSAGRCVDDSCLEPWVDDPEAAKFLEGETDNTSENTAKPARKYFPQQTNNEPSPLMELRPDWKLSRPITSQIGSAAY